MWKNLSLGGLDTDGRSSLFLEQHGVVSVKVGEVGSRLSCSELLGPCGGIPLGLDAGLLPEFGNGSRASRSWKSRNDIGGEGEVGVGDDLSRDLGSGSIDQSSVVVDDLDDGRQGPGIWSNGDVDDSTDLYESLETFVLRGRLAHDSSKHQKLLHRWCVAEKCSFHLLRFENGDQSA